MPSLSQYVYTAKDVKADDKPTWEITDNKNNVAKIVSKADQPKVTVEYALNAGSLKLKLSLNGNPALEQKIVVVRVDIGADRKFFPEKTFRGPASDVAEHKAFLQASAVAGQKPEYVKEHVPGSDVAAFAAKNVTNRKAEPAYRIDPPKGPKAEHPGLQILMNVSLSIPAREDPAAFQQIQTGFIQHIQARGIAYYKNEKDPRRLFLDGEEAEIGGKGLVGLDWSEGGIWPWFGSKADSEGTQPWSPSAGGRSRYERQNCCASRLTNILAHGRSTRLTSGGADGSPLPPSTDLPARHVWDSALAAPCALADRCSPRNSPDRR